MLEAKQASAEEAVRARERDIASHGIIVNHAYSILDCVEVPAAEGGMRLLRLRNPWSSGRASAGAATSWTGAWCDASPSWRAVPDLQARLGAYVQEETGVFWMAVEDFVHYFTRLDLARLHQADLGWSTVRVAVPLVNSGDTHVTVIRVRAFEATTPLEVVMNQQPYNRGGGGGGGAGGGGSGGGGGGAGGGGLPTSTTPRYVRDRECYVRDIGMALVQEKRSDHTASDWAAGLARTVRRGDGLEAEGMDAAGNDPALVYRTTGMTYLGGCDRRVEPFITMEAGLPPGEEAFLVPLSFRSYNESECLARRTSGGGGAGGSAGRPSPSAAAAAAAAGRGSLLRHDTMDWMVGGAGVSSAPWGSATDATQAAGLTGSGAEGHDFVVVAVHSGQPVIVDVVRKPLSWLARAAAAQVFATGRRSDFKGAAEASGVCLYSLTEGVGTRVAVANTHATLPVTYRLACSGLVGVATTRGIPLPPPLPPHPAAGGGTRESRHAAPPDGTAYKLEMQDTLPPGTAALMCVMVSTGPCASRSWSSSYNVEFGGDAPRGPVIANQLPPTSPGGLHAPFPLTVAPRADAGASSYLFGSVAAPPTGVFF